ncbi:MAG: hypothetical protein JW717_12405 [Marinilabiliaceae bacterium]|nr:hypothetical protein [Marinilabiliaceae bacterium]
MKSKDLRNKSIADFPSQDDFMKGRNLKIDYSKRSKKPSIYDDLDDDLDVFLSRKYNDDSIDEFDDDDEDFDDEDDEDYDDEEDEDRY